MDAAARAGKDAVVHLPLKYLDDRGQPLGNDRDLTIADARASGASRAAARAALRPATLLVWACLVAGLAGIMGLTVLIDALERHMPKAVAYAIGFAIAVAMYAVVGSIVQAPARRAYRRGWLSLGLCPGCAYRITEIEPQQDGCRVCPECGSAWRLDDSIEGSAS